jgi:hypothetical protein
MDEARKSFSEVLNAHDDAALKAAFERVNRSGGHSLHRTTLLRWQEGSVPKSEDVVRLLAAELRDDELLDAWRASRGSRRSSPDGVVVGQFERLSPEERLLAYPEIRRLYLEARFPRLLRGVSYRIEVNDPTDGSDDHLMIRMQMEYDSDLPARARVALVATHRELSDAYESQQCIFRDRVPLAVERLEELLQVGPAPNLTYNRLDESPQRLVSSAGSWVEPGLYEFDNDVVDAARVRIDAEYPYPRSLQQYPIRFGEFRVTGGAEFSLVLNAASTSAPQAFAFPPAGRQREWAVTEVRPNRELVASMGAGGSILADGDGLVLSWHEAK